MINNDPGDLLAAVFLTFALRASEYEIKVEKDKGKE